MHLSGEREDEGPDQSADGSALKDTIGRWEVGKQQLHDDHDGYPGEDPLIGEYADTKNRMLQRTAVEQVEDFGQDKDIDRDGPAAIPP